MRLGVPQLQNGWIDKHKFFSESGEKSNIFEFSDKLKMKCIIYEVFDHCCKNINTYSFRYIYEKWKYIHINNDKRIYINNYNNKDIYVWEGTYIIIILCMWNLNKWAYGANNKKNYIHPIFW